MQIERASEDANDIRMIAKHSCNGLTDVFGPSRDPEDAIRLVVDEGEARVAGDREHTVAHAGNDVPVEGIGRPGVRACRAEAAGGGGTASLRTHLVRAGGSPSGRAWARLGHHR